MDYGPEYSCLDFARLWFRLGVRGRVGISALITGRQCNSRLIEK